ncbi:hypothetical protein, partial [Burkholderia territorii]|uniref:hypothetical protein n=1 Tax=Burkholderia territorii TaxID=1503055 RepID=UPI000755938D
LSLVATPAELDAEFAAAVEVYEPGATSLLDQARACAAANQSDANTTALPASNSGDAAGTSGKRGRGRPPKASKADDGKTPPSNDGAHDGATDPRQMRIDDAGQPSGASGTPAAESPTAAVPASTSQPQPTDAGVDLY